MTAVGRWCRRLTIAMQRPIIKKVSESNYAEICPGCLDPHNGPWCHRFLWRCFEDASGCKSFRYSICPACRGMYCPVCEPHITGRWCSIAAKSSS